MREKYTSYEQCCDDAKRIGESGWIFDTKSERGFVFLVSGFEHYCSVGFVPVCRVDIETRFTPMFCGVKKEGL